jgi:hypothetical protein
VGAKHRRRCGAPSEEAASDQKPELEQNALAAVGVETTFAAQVFDALAG